MKIKLAKGDKENGIVIGNAYDKYGSKNPIVKVIMKGFHDSLNGLVNKVKPKSINEIGCGEGYWVIKWSGKGILTKGSDFSEQVIEIAKENAKSQRVDPDLFSVKNIYELEEGKENADLIVCCEVLEHLDDPKLALQSLEKIVDHYLIISVPREPIWRFLNLLRGKYIKDLGNTPGHLQHWSSAKLVDLVSNYFEIIEVKKPFPWTMLLCKAKK